MRPYRGVAHEPGSIASSNGTSGGTIAGATLLRGTAAPHQTDRCDRRRAERRRAGAGLAIDDGIAWTRCWRPQIAHLRGRRVVFVFPHGLEVER